MVQVSWLQMLIYLNWLFEIDMESVARSVREEFGIIFGQYAPESFQFDANAVLGSAVGRAVESEADDKNALVNAELNAVTTAAISPLIAAVGRRLESVALLLFQSSSQFRTIGNETIRKEN